MAGTKSSAPPPVSATQFLERVGTLSLPPVIVLAGSERWFRETAIAAVLARVFPSGDPGGGVLRLSARDPAQCERVGTAVEELRSSSLFGEGRVVVVEHPESAGGVREGDDESEDDQDDARDDRPQGGSDGSPRAAAGRGAAPPAKRGRSPLLDLALPALAAAIDGAVLLLSTERPVKGRGAVPLATLSKAGALVVDCRAPYDAPAPWERGAKAYEHELARHLVLRSKVRFAKRLALQEAHALTRRVGSDLDDLEQALATLALYAGERPAFSAEDVEACFRGERENPVWPLVDAVLDGRLAEAVERLEGAFREGLADPRGLPLVRPEALYPLISSALLTGYRRVLAGAEALARGESDDEVAASSGVPPFLSGPHLARCRRDPGPWLARHVAFLQAERGVKSGRVPPDVALERLIVSLAAPRSGPRAGGG